LKKELAMVLGEEERCGDGQIRLTWTCSCWQAREGQVAGDVGNDVARLVAPYPDSERSRSGYKADLIDACRWGLSAQGLDGLP